MRTFTLTTKAHTSGGYEYPVTLVESENQYRGCKGDHYPRKNDFTLRIQGTPGQWYMTTLEQNPLRDRIAIDFGQNWYCTNFGAVMAEAVKLLEDIDRLTVAEVQAADEGLLSNLFVRGL